MCNKDGSSPALIRCTFRQNSIYYDYDGAGMTNLYDSNPTLTHCKFINNTALSGSGAGMYNAKSSPKLLYCEFIGNDGLFAGGMLNYSYSSPTLSHCTFIDNSADRNIGGGMYNNHYSSPTLEYCIFKSNSSNGGGGMHNSFHSSPKLTHCEFIQNSAHEDGGGLYNRNDSNPILTNCIFRENSAVDCGGGIFNKNNSSPNLFNCVLTANFVTNHGGGMYNIGGIPTLKNCTFSNNTAFAGAGIDNQDSNTILNHCTFVSNSTEEYGAGINNFGSSPVLTNCIFIDNVANDFGGGGICNWSSKPKLINCLFRTNVSAERGGAVMNNRSDPHLFNCTFVDNAAGGAGNAVAFFSYNLDPPSAMLAANCIFRDDGDEIFDHGEGTWLPSTISVTYSNVQGGWPGVGNIDADPCFVEPGYWDANGVWVEGDYRLLPDSPCIDAGDNNSLPPDITDVDGDGDTNEPLPWDLDGNPRVVEGDGDGIAVVDMGAYEASASQVCFGVNHLRIAISSGKKAKDKAKGSDIDVKGTFTPTVPIDLSVDDVMYFIDDGEGNVLDFLIPAGSFKPEGKPEHQKYKYDSPKKAKPEIKAKFDFGKCMFELKTWNIPEASEISGTMLTVGLQSGVNIGEEVLETQVKEKHLEYKKKPKLDCCPDEHAPGPP
jgi:hypothetical protein